LDKHPKALSMRKNVAYKFLKGEIFFNFDLNENNRKTKLPKEFILRLSKKNELELLKSIIEKNLSTSRIKTIKVFDYLENTDLDLWVQNLGVTKNKILYYPISRHLNVNKLKHFLKKYSD
jgi:hypothetical protein